jgi:hypothetical protein
MQWIRGRLRGCCLCKCDIHFTVMKLFWVKLIERYMLGSNVRENTYICQTSGRPNGRSSSPGRGKNFLHIVQTGSLAHPASYPMARGGYFPGGKAAGAWSWPLTSS